MLSTLNTLLLKPLIQVAIGLLLIFLGWYSVHTSRETSRLAKTRDRLTQALADTTRQYRDTVGTLRTNVATLGKEVADLKLANEQVKTAYLIQQIHEKEKLDSALIRMATLPPVEQQRQVRQLLDQLVPSAKRHD